MPGVVYTFKRHPDGKFAFPYASAQTINVFGVPPQELEVNPAYPFERTHPDDIKGLLDKIRISAETMTQFDYLGRVKKEDGGWRWIQVRSSPELQSDGSIIWDGVMLDVTKEIEAMQELDAIRLENMHYSKLSALGEMAAGIGHEINNPLAVVLGFCSRINSLLEGGELSKENLREYVSKISHNADRIHKIIQSLKRLSYKDETMFLEEHSVKQMFDDVLELCRERFRASGVELTTDMVDKNLAAVCVSTEICQVLINLLNNALDAVEDAKEKWIKISAKIVENAVEICVTDSGPGLTPEAQEKLWQPFFTTKAVGRGTGLGLSISRRLVERNKGTLSYDKNSPHTRFVVTLPKI